MSTLALMGMYLKPRRYFTQASNHKLSLRTITTSIFVLALKPNLLVYLQMKALTSREKAK